MKTLIYLIILRFLVFITSRWIWNFIYVSAGKTKKDVWRYRMSLSNLEHTHRYMYKWLTEDSSDPQRTKRLISICNFETFVSMIGIAVAFLGLFVTLFDRVSFFICIITVFLIIGNVVAKCFYDKKHDVLNEDSKYKNSRLIDDIKTIVSMIREKRKETYGEGIGVKRYFLGITTLAFIIVLMIGAVILIINVTNPKKIPAETAVVEQILTSKGFNVIDNTKATREKWNGGEEIKKSIIAENNNSGFGYYIFDSKELAANVGSQFVSIDREKWHDENTVESKDASGNYVIFTMTTEKKYVLVMRVENTLVHAICNKENIELIQNVMSEIGYFRTKDKEFID